MARWGMAVGHSAVVSGGGTGIGAASAAALAADGYRAVIVGRRPEVPTGTAARINQQVGRSDAVRPVVADLAEPADVAAVSSTVDDTVDVLVNNAGGFLAR